jgi:Protein of unknown function (DUF4232)
MRAGFATGVVLVAIAAGCGGSKTVTVTQATTTVRTVTFTTTTTATTTAGPGEAAACTGADLTGRFAVVPGSAGAGNIVYSLLLTNTSASPCFVSGLPAVTLLDRNGSPLPTHVSAAQPGQPAAARIVLQSGDSTKADARFSPDVPSTGEQQTGACEPKAYVLRVTAPGGGTVAAPISPPTAVCGHGALSFSVFTSAP